MNKFVVGILALALLSCPADAAIHKRELVMFGGGLKPSLDLQLLASLPSVVNFARVGPRSCTSSAGLVTTVGSGSPCLDFNPATLAAIGLLVEESRINLVLQSQFASGWTTGVNASLTQSAAVGPDGVTGSAVKIVEAATTAQHLAFQSALTIVAGATVSASTWLKQGGRTTAWLAVSDATFATGFRAVIDLAAGTITSSTAFGTGTKTAASITAYPNSWFRVTVTGTVDPATTTAARLEIYLNAGASYLGDGVSGLFAFGAGFEAGAFPTSYIPTTTTTVTRNADVPTAATSAFAFNSNVGTLVLDAALEATGGSNFPFFAVLDDGSGNNQIGWYYDQGAGNLKNKINTGGVSQFEQNAGAPGIAAFKTGQAWMTNNGALTFNGALAATKGATLTVPTGLTTLRLSGAFGSSPPNGWIKRIRYFNQRLFNSQLQAVTQ